MIRFICPKCGLKLKVEDRRAGMVRPCPNCGRELVVPSSSAGDASASGSFVRQLKRSDPTREGTPTGSIPLLFESDPGFEAIQYYYAEGEQPLGPLSFRELGYINISSESLIWRDGLQDWLPARQVPEFRGMFEAAPPLPVPKSAQAPIVEDPPPTKPLRWRPQVETQGLAFVTICAYYLTILFVTLIVIGVMVIPADFHKASTGFWMFGVVGAGICGFASQVFEMVLLHRCWFAIQDGRARTTPNAAVVLMLIPLVNFFWRFVALYGLTQDLNKYAKRHNRKMPRANEGAGVAYAVLPFAGIILGIFPVFLIPYLVAGCIVVTIYWVNVAKASEDASRRPPD